VANKKFFATKDNTITNVFNTNSTTIRATGSNTGLADSVSVFKLYDRLDAEQTELARTLIQFNSNEIVSERAAGRLASSGSVDFFLNLYNAPHPFTVPTQFDLLVQPISRSWDEGSGVDIDNFTDTGISNWVSASSAAAWTSEGGDYKSEYDVTASFVSGTENLSVNISDIVEKWVDGTLDNYGLGIRLSGTFETDTENYYVKKFFARSTEYFFKKPTIEARWDSSTKDERGSFYASSSLLTAAENLNTVYLYNRFRGALRNIPSIEEGAIYVKVFDASSGGTELSSNVTVNYPVTGGYVSTGTYSASFDLATTASTVYDRWFDSTLTTCFFTGTIKVNQISVANNNALPKYVLDVTNLKDNYSRQEKDARIRLYARNKDWSPTIYTVASTDIENTAIENIYYKVKLLASGEDVVSYGTGSSQNTLMSYDASGNYFDFDMSLLEEGNGYGFKFIIKQGSNYYEYPQVFKFRVLE